MKCIIIAAGQGSRISTKGDSKPLIHLLGLPLIERVISTAKKGGITDFFIVTGYRGEKIRAYLGHVSQSKNINLTHIVNEEWEKENGISVLKAKPFLNEAFILLMGDHLFDPSILINLQKEKINHNQVILGVDHNIKTNQLVDVNDVTKVLVKERRILEIGKNLKNYNAYDTGIFLCSPAIFRALEVSSSNGDSSLSGGIRVLCRSGNAKAFDIRDDYWIDVDDETSFKKAEDRLLDTLKKTSDGPVSRYLNRPLSIRITKHLSKTKIAPNHISIFSFILGLLGAMFFFLGGYLNLITGAILAQISSVIDGCDGEIARIKFRVTEFGGWFDAVLDRYADAFLLFGLTYHVYRLEPEDISLSILVGFMAIIGTFMNSYTADKYDGLMKRKLGPEKYYFRVGRDVRVFIILLGALINMPFLTLGIVAVSMNAENVRRVWLLSRK